MRLTFLNQYQAIFDQTDDRTLILTPNQRLSRFIGTLFDDNQKQRKRSAWHSLPCNSLYVWAQELWCLIQIRAAHKAAAKTLLSPAQEHLLWRRCIAANAAEFEEKNGVELFEHTFESYAESMAEAWHLLQQWQLPLQEISDASVEFEFFKRCAESYQNKLDYHHFIDREQQLETIIELFRQGQNFVGTEKVFCLGFDTLSPLNLCFLDSLAAANISVEHFNITVQADCSNRAFNSKKAEIEGAAQWAHEQAKKNKKIAVVIPSLSRDRGLVEKIFKREFEPQSLLPSSPRQATGFNVSAAEMLSDTPVIRAAIDLLNLNCERNPIDLIGRILQSVFIGEAGELPARMAFLSELKTRYKSISLIQLRSELASFNENLKYKVNAEKFYQALYEWMQVRNKSQFLSPQDWLKQYKILLSIFAWPGVREADTIEYQQLQMWPDILVEFSQLQKTQNKLQVDEALKYLRKISGKPFQVQTMSSPVQVLGLLEAAGMHFDALWVAQMQDGSWPEPLAPNPFIPVHIQREHEMPRACVAHELDYAREVTQRLSRSAAKVIFSYAKWDGEQPLNPSLLVSHFAKEEAKELNITSDNDYKRVLFDCRSASTMENFIDTLGSKFSKNEIAQGGTNILKDQAACPFRAFAIYRLGARSNEEITMGMSLRDRGSLIHESLDLLWQDLCSLDRLLAMPENELLELVREKIKIAWRNVMPTLRYGEQLKTIELLRTETMLLKWLAIEKTRESFTVERREKNIIVQLGALSIKMRIDRIDRLGNSEHLAIIDYKTSDSNINSWQGERPDEPQVPLYCIATEHAGAAAFGVINAKTVEYVGIAEQRDLFSGLKEVNEIKGDNQPDNWPQLITQWRDTLNRLASEFIHGEARVDPKKFPATCQYCELKSLCRIHTTNGDTVG